MNLIGLWKISGFQLERGVNYETASLGAIQGVLLGLPASNRNAVRRNSSSLSHGLKLLAAASSALALIFVFVIALLKFEAAAAPYI